MNRAQDIVKLLSMEHDSEPSLPPGFPTQGDLDQYPTLAIMKRLGTPMTREKYVELAYLKPNPEIGPEEEAELPAPFRRDASQLNCGQPLDLGALSVRMTTFGVTDPLGGANKRRKLQRHSKVQC